MLIVVIRILFSPGDYIAAILQRGNIRLPCKPTACFEDNFTLFGQSIVIICNDGIVILRIVIRIVVIGVQRTSANIQCER